MEEVVIAHVVKMVAEVVEVVVVAHQFLMGMVPLIFQTGNKCRLNNGRGKNSHNQGRCRFYQMKTIYMCSICHL